MSEIDRIREIQTKSTEARLVKGAEILGSLWRDGVRCPSGWAPSCVCRPGTEFCDARRRWVELASPLGRVFAAFSPSAVIEEMTWQEFLATRLTLRVQRPNLPSIALGGRGLDTKGTQDLLDCAAAGEEALFHAWSAVAEVQGAWLR